MIRLYKMMNQIITIQIVKTTQVLTLMNPQSQKRLIQHQTGVSIY